MVQVVWVLAWARSQESPAWLSGVQPFNTDSDLVPVLSLGLLYKSSEPTETSHCIPVADRTLKVV